MYNHYNQIREKCSHLFYLPKTLDIGNRYLTQTNQRKLAGYSEQLEDLLDHHLIDNEELVKKKETNGIGYLINGNMCLGVYEDLMVARIGKSLAESLVGKSGIYRYLPDNGLYDDFIMIEESIYNHSKALQKFIDQSIAYTRELPPKDHGKEDI